MILVLIVLFFPQGLGGLINEKLLVRQKEEGCLSVHFRNQGLEKVLGGVVAVHGVDLEVQTNAIHSVIGPNGAGKTTLFNLISGYFPCDEGRVFLRGVDVTGFSPESMVSLGLGRSFQVTSIFAGLTVLENIQATILFAEATGCPCLQTLDP